MKILVTGAAGFIGFHLTERLLDGGYEVTGLDNINDFNDVKLKLDRLSHSGIIKPVPGRFIQSQKHSLYRFIQEDLRDSEAISRLFESEKPDVVINLAAQPGVRYSLKNPHAYVDNNITGFLNILEGCRNHPVKHLIYASSSSIYGANREMPFSVSDHVDYPVSLYAATKKSNELMAHTYSHLFRIPTTGLRFFTVYGPWGRPDMAPFLFTDAILSGKSINIFNHGDMARDFTYIDDIVEGVFTLMDQVPEIGNEITKSNPSVHTDAPYQLFNIGFGSPVRLMDFIGEIEKNLKMEADKNYQPMQPGDMPETWADVSDLYRLTGFKPHTSLKKGIRQFISWYLEYYNIDKEQVEDSSK